MKVRALYFGIVTDLTGKTEEEWELADDALLEDFQQSVSKAYPDMLDLKRFALAVNEDYAEGQHKLSSGDTIAIIPPVSGG